MSRPLVSIAPGAAAADRRLDRVVLAGAAPEDPLDDPAVVAEAGPHELAVGVLAEPVDQVDARQLGPGLLADLEPVGPVVGHVVAAERQHRERVEAQLADRAEGGGRHLRAHDRAEEDAVLPVEALANQRHDGGPAAAEHDRVDRDAGRVLPVRGDGRILAGRSGEAGVGVSRRLVAPGAQSLPVQSMRWAGGSLVRPSHHTSPSSVRAQLV
jgi:hypothetical protein